MALLSKFQDGQALIIDGLTPGEKPKTKLVVQALRMIRRPDLTESEAIVVEGETKAKSLRRTLDGRTILFGLPANDPALSSPDLRPVRSGPRTLPGHPPPLDHREGNSPLGAA